MKINRISWQNYRGLADGEIVADGNDVIITGHNGAGKSSIASVLPFVLFGKGASSIKTFDGGHIQIDDGGIVHAAEIEFDDGTTLRREYSWQGKANRHALFINDTPAKPAEFTATIYDLTSGLNEFAFNPFAFCSSPAKDQRSLLIKIFGSDVQISDNLKTILAGQSPEKFLLDAKRELKNLKADAAFIPAKIEENKRAFKNFPADIDKAIRDAQSQLDKNFAQRDKLQKEKDFNYRLGLAQKQLADLISDKNHAQRQADSLGITRQKLLAEYRALKNSKCPTCGQSVVSNPERLKTIEADGKKIAADIKDFQAQIAECDSKINEAQKLVDELNAESKDNLFGSELEQVNNSIADLSKQLAELQGAQKIRDRINELNSTAANLVDDINQLNVEIQAVSDFVQLKIEHIETQINSRFEFVSFKLFDVAITTGEVKPTCEATLHGVPFASLSKGEKLKAALDVFNTLQNHFKLNLPLFLDDAESYTVNSFIDLPNQLWLFKVTDEDQLNIKTVSKS